MGQLKVGDTIWRFDTNRRVYPPRKPGQDRYASTGGPIYREYWHPVEITGETRVSWITLYGKVPKKCTDTRRRGWAFTLQEVEDDVWVNDHLHLMQRALSCALNKYDPDIRAKMGAIAKIINFNPELWK